MNNSVCNIPCKLFLLSKIPHKLLTSLMIIKKFGFFILNGSVVLYKAVRSMRVVPKSGVKISKAARVKRWMRLGGLCLS